MLTLNSSNLEFQKPTAQTGLYSDHSNEAVFNIEFETGKHFKQ